MAAALAIYRRNDDGPGLQCMGLNLGSVALDAGDPERAVSLLEESAQLGRAQDLDRNLSWTLAELGEAAVAIGDRERAQRALAEALVLFERNWERRGADHVRALQERLAALAGGVVSLR